MNANLLPHFINNAYFKQNVSYLQAPNTAYVNGRPTNEWKAAVTKACVLIQATPTEMINAGYGKFSDSQSFHLYSDWQIGLNDLIVYNGIKYQRINSEDWTAYGFNKYIITVYNAETLR